MSPAEGVISTLKNLYLNPFVVVAAYGFGMRYGNALVFATMQYKHRLVDGCNCGSNIQLRTVLLQRFPILIIHRHLLPCSLVEFVPHAIGFPSVNLFLGKQGAKSFHCSPRDHLGDTCFASGKQQGQRSSAAVPNHIKRNLFYLLSCPPEVMLNYVIHDRFRIRQFQQRIVAGESIQVGKFRRTLWRSSVMRKIKLDQHQTGLLKSTCHEMKGPPVFESLESVKEKHNARGAIRWRIHIQQQRPALGTLDQHIVQHHAAPKVTDAPAPLSAFRHRRSFSPIFTGA